MFHSSRLAKSAAQISPGALLLGSGLLLLASGLGHAGLAPAGNSDRPNPGATGANLLSVYQKGEIPLVPDPAFGRGPDWKEYLGDKRLGLVVAADGSVFVTQMLQNACLKFDASGRFVARFGKPGQGPGDLNHPTRLDILDGRSLVVMEGSESRRISLFDLDGKFIKLLQAENPVFGLTALSGRTIAYMTYRLQPKGPFLLKKSRVILKDLETGTEKTVCGGEIFRPEDQVFSALVPNPPKIDYGAGDLIVDRTREGELLVGFTSSPTIVIFDAAGRRLRTIDLKLPAVPFTGEILSGFQESVYRELVEGAGASITPEKKAGFRKRADAAGGSIRFLPYLKDIQVDAEGNILIFERDPRFVDCPDLPIRVFGPDGAFRTAVRIIKGDFELEADRRWRNMVFTASGLYAAVTIKNSPDQEMRLVRVAF